MKNTIAGLSAPVLAGVVREKTAGAAKAEIENCLCHGAGMIDLHLSCLSEKSEENFRRIIEWSPLPILALYYPGAPELAAGLAEEDRTETLFRAVRAGAAGVDLQGYSFHQPSKAAFCGEDRYSFTKGGPKEVVTDPEVIGKQTAFIEKVHAAGAEVLLSCHPGIFLDRDQVVELALFLEKRGPDVLKIVSVAHNEDELIESFAAMLLLKKEVRTPVVYHASGKAGRLSRVINPLLGGHIAFCVDRFREGHTLEMLDLETANRAVADLKRIMR